MDSTKDCGSVNRPPVLDGTNYYYWKIKMFTFLKPMKKKTWKAVMKSSTHPVVFDQDGISSLKPEDEWIIEALGNSKVLNAIFNEVDKNMLRLINTCTEVNEA
jgi:hypothetical protein